MSNGAAKRLMRNREKILAAAEKVFLQNGFPGATMDEVAATAGISKQTVYAHFGSKESLFIEVVEAMAGGASQALEKKVGNPAEDRSVEEFLLDFAQEQLSVVLTPRLMQLRRLVIGEVERFPDLGRTLYREGPERSIERLGEALQRYVSRGELSCPDPLAAGAYFNWLVMGEPTSRAMLLGDKGIPSKHRLRQHAAESVRIFMAAFRP